jgi:hypothetical protein
MILETPFLEESPMKWKENSDHNYEQPSLGTHIARCVKVIDIGTQKGEYQGKVTIKRQCIVGWELPNELMQEGEWAGKPFVVSKFYTASLNEKANLRKDLENWRNKPFTDAELAGFESKNILGKPCMVTLNTTQNGKVKVSSVTSVPKGTPIPTQVNNNLYFSLEPEEFDASIYEGLSDGIKKMIQMSPEFKVIHEPQPVATGGAEEGPDEQIPF